MLGFDTRAARTAWTVFLVALLLVGLYYIRTVVLVFILAILLAYMLAPIVNLVDRMQPWTRSRTYSLAVVYTALIGLLILAGVLVGNRVAQEASNLATGFPELQKTVVKRLQEPWPAWFEPLRQQIREGAQNLGPLLVPLMQQAGARILSVLPRIVFVVLIPILSFFFLKDGRELRERALALVRPERRAMWDDIAGDIHVLLGRFIRALALLALATLTAYGIFFTVIGLPYSLLLATIAGTLEFIPLFGPVAAVAIVVLVAVISGFGHFWLILVSLVAYRMFQDYFLSPHLMSAGVALHPLLVIFGALAGGELAGIPGMFLSVPVMATLRVLYVRVRKAREMATLTTPATSP
ncbi:MAG: AI-2E family transporter [Bryobacteraceae bacterium]|jgi:predicted PurR-regulated permease PerM